MYLAVIDIGTNSTRLMVSEVEAGLVKIVHTEIITTRLGEGIGKQPFLQRGAVNRTVDALFKFKEKIGQLGPVVVLAAATSAVRDAANRIDFLAEVKARVGWEVKVLSGVEEARMSFLGVMRGLKSDISDPVVIDIGGGSTEFIWARPETTEFRSLRVGAVRMAESGSGMDDIIDSMAGVIEIIKKACLKSIIGVGGTVTTLAAIDQRLEVYDPELVHGYFISRQRVAAILETLEKMSPGQRRKVPGLQPERADIIVAGTRIVRAIIEGLDGDGVTVSETDIMYGLLYSELEQKTSKYEKFC